MVFAPAPVLTVTVERRADDADIHLHAGGQGVWQARMLTALGARAVVCGSFGGESGVVLHSLLESEGIEVHAVSGPSRNGVYIHDRRAGKRTPVAESPGEPLPRHELDELYNLALVQGLDAQVCLLSGPSPVAREMVPDELYRRLAADLTSNGRRVVADLAGDRLTAVLRGGAYLVKVSHEELRATGLAQGGTAEEIAAAMQYFRAAGCQVVVVSRAEQPALALIGDELYEVVMVRMHPADPSGAGDSMTAGIVAGLLRGDDVCASIRLGAAAGALNVTRHGLGTGDREGVERLATQVAIRPTDLEVGHRETVSRRQLATWMDR